MSLGILFSSLKTGTENSCSTAKCQTYQLKPLPETDFRDFLRLSFPLKSLVSGGIDFYGNNLNTTEIYDPEIDSWYYSQDVPSNGKLSVWNEDPLMIDREKIWKFENGKWTLMESKPTGYFYQNFAFTLPDDFITDCQSSRLRQVMKL